MNDAEKDRHAIMATMVHASRRCVNSPSWRWPTMTFHKLAPPRLSGFIASVVGVRQITLASYIGIEGTSLVRLLDELSAAGLLVRKDDPHDRRAKTIWLTPAGVRLAEEAEKVLAELRDRVLGGVADADLDATIRVCQALHRSADRACAGSAPIVEQEAVSSATFRSIKASSTAAQRRCTDIWFAGWRFAR